MSDDNPLARAGRESAGNKYDRHRAAARSLLAEPMDHRRPVVNLAAEPDADAGFYPFISYGADNNLHTIAFATPEQYRISKGFVTGTVGVVSALALFIASAVTMNLLVMGVSLVVVPVVCASLLLSARRLMLEGRVVPEVRKAVERDKLYLDDLTGTEADLTARAVDALGQIALSNTWQSDWLRAPREQTNLAREAEQIVRAGHRLTRLSASIGDKPDDDGVRAEQWERLNEAYTVGVSDLRRRAEEAVALRLAVDDVADLIAEAEKRRIEASKLGEGETLAAQVLAESPEHARAADRLAELTAATGSVHEVLALEIAADLDAIESAAGALAGRGELT